MEGRGLAPCFHYLRSERRHPGELGHHMGDHRHLWGERWVGRMNSRQRKQEGLPTLPLALTPLESWTGPLCEQLHTLAGEETDLRRVQGQCLGLPSLVWCPSLTCPPQARLTWKPRLPRHQLRSSVGGMSITETMSPTWEWADERREGQKRLGSGVSSSGVCSPTASPRRTAHLVLGLCTVSPHGQRPPQGY